MGFWNNIFRRTKDEDKYYSFFRYGGMLKLTEFEYGEVVFQNMVQILVTLMNDVEFFLEKGDKIKFQIAKSFLENKGVQILSSLYLNGFCFIGEKRSGFDIVEDREDVIVEGGLIRSNNSKYKKIYVIKSPLFENRNISEFDFLQPYIKFLNNIFNSSNTLTSNMGAFVIATPESSNFNISPNLTKKEKEDLEREVSKTYGSLSNQRQIMILPNAMKFDVINLANVDLKLTDKVKICVLIMADNLQIPANQISLINGGAAKSLNTGGELVEGDLLKYKTFERLLNLTFMRFFTELGMIVDYNIYNKPKE